MEYIISGLFNTFLVQFKDLNINLQQIFAESKSNINILRNPIGKVGAAIFARYLEEVVRIKKNNRVGLESGFLIPFMLTGTFFNLYRNCKTVSELFANMESLDSTTNTISSYETRLEGDYLYYEITVDSEFMKMHPIAGRQWIEMQYGIGLQYAYSFTARFLHPVYACTPYAKEGNNDLLEEYLDCPIRFNQAKMGMAFKKSVLNLPIITTKKELLPIFENIMGEIEYKQDKSALSGTIRRYLNHSLSTATLGLKPIAEKFNMSERNIQRKLKAEGTSYQQILDGLRIELAQKYLRDKIPLAEITFLLGFETQSAFNKFFQKHFKTTPGRFSIKK